MCFEEVEDVAHDYAGTKASLGSFTCICVATVIVNARCAFGFVDLGRDARGHETFAVSTGNHATQEVSLCSLSFLHRFHHLEGRPNVRKFVDCEKGIDRDSGFKIANSDHVYDGVTEHMYACIDWVAKQIADLLDGHSEGLPWLLGCWSAGVTVLIQKVCNLFLRLPICTELKRLLYQNPILAIRTEIIVRVFVIAVRSDVDRLALLQGSTLPTLHDFAQMVAVLLGKDERDAKEHFTHWCVLETECGKRKVFDDLFVEQVDDLACIRHVASETVGMPCENCVVLAEFDVLDHGLELVTYVRLFRAFLLFHDGDVFFRNAHAFSRIKTVELLVRKGTFLPLVGGSRLAHVHNKTELGDVYHFGLGGFMKGYEGVMQIF